MSAAVSLFRWRTLPSGYHAQPILGGERNGIKWLLERVYDSRGRLDHDRTYWEIFHDRADDPAPRSVAYAELASLRVPFLEFMRTTTSLAQVEGWISRARARSRKAPVAQRAEVSWRQRPTPQPA